MKMRALVAAATLLLAATGARAEMSHPRVADLGQNVHFLDGKGGIERGVRCAAPSYTPEQKARVAAETAELERLNGGFSKAVKNVAVVWHVIHDGRTGNISDAMIDAQIGVLNDAFASRGFSFTVVGTTRTRNKGWYTGCYNRTTESKMKQALAVDPANHLNIYSCKPNGGILGYAYLPATFGESHYLHGVVLLHSSLPGGSAAPYNEGDTGTHEVGHYLGLEHTFENGCSAPGDFVADTAYEQTEAYGCPVGRNTCPDAALDPITNFMDYTDDSCMDNFTSGQGDRMVAQVATYKPSL
jgi:hypothetical protein